MAATNQSPTGFGLYDLLTRVVPGAVSIAPALLPIIVNPVIISKVSVGITSGVIFVVFSVIAFIFGEGIDILRVESHPVPRSFRQALYEERGNEQMLGIIDRMKQKIPFLSISYSMVYTDTKKEFWPTFKYQYDIDDEFENVEDIYRIFLSYIEPKLSNRTRRYQTMMIFVENMTISLVFGLLLSVIGWVLLSVSTFWLVLLLLFYIPPLVFIPLFFSSVESTFVRSLFIEYFADQAPLAGDLSNKSYR